MASTSEAPTHQKNGKGRKKVVMEKMEKKSNLQVTFSKRRSGLFKKGSELCTLTGSNIGIIVFSPGKKVFSFGHPSVHDVVDECFPKESEDGSTSSDVVWTPSSDKSLEEAHRSASLAEESVKMLSVEKQMEAAKRWTTAIEEAEKAQAEGQVDIDAMTEEDLVEMGMRLNLLRDNLIRMKNNGVNSDQATSLHSVRDETGNPDSDPCVT